MFNNSLITINFRRSVLYDDRTTFLVLFNFVRGGRCDSTDRAYSNKVYRTRTRVDTKGEIAQRSQGESARVEGGRRAASLRAPYT